MNGIYIHIPFCKKVCFYCDFHFTVSLKQKDRLIEAIIKEIDLRKDYIGNQHIESIYLGGGTPSILSSGEIGRVLNQIDKYFSIADDNEITLEVNPDDINMTYLRELQDIGINRLSIGIQSFFDEDLHWMNRRHTAEDAELSVKLSQDIGFHNLNIDLIYGNPGLSVERWTQNLETFFRLNVPHLSAYHLTIEPKTVFGYYKRKGRLSEMNEDESLAQYEILINKMQAHGYQHYEISNFCKDGYYARHNTNYWKQGNYLGLGPSAHSFNGHSRQWNVSVNSRYIDAIKNGEPFYESEDLTENDRFNEYLLTRLRTMWGIDTEEIAKNFGEKYLEHLNKRLIKFKKADYVKAINNKIYLTETGMFVSDSIISELFWA
jgi:oxygen-independent coproporphyrinogen-3 oxidase